jgi:hypothetical protein
MLIDISTLSITDSIGTTASTPNISADTYFFDTDTRLVTSRKSGSIEPIYGTVKGNHRWYTFVNRYGRSTSIREDRIKQAARQWTEATVRAVSTPSAATNHGWIIGTVNGSHYSFSTTPRVHDTEASVNTEIERLAKANPGTVFIKVKIESRVQAGGVSWS